MDYTIIESNFIIDIIDYKSEENILNHTITISYDSNIEKYKIIDFIGSGVIGKIYLLENINKINKEKYVIKISNDDCYEELTDEIETFKKYYKKNNIIHKLYPKYYGEINNLDYFGIIYPYFGKYNLEKIKLHNINISYNDNINIIIQLILQLKSFNNLIHCDLKSANVVISDDNKHATIVDIGLLRAHNICINVYSTNFITSPESLLTINCFSDCVYDIINLEKNDYFGLFTIIISLFIKVDYWNIISYYLIDELKLKKDFILTHESSILYVYLWYKFNNKKVENTSLFNIITKIEALYPSLLKRNYIDYNTFFKQYIIPAINYETINEDKLILLENFTSLLIKFEPNERPSYDVLLTHPFLQV
jgi:hypothetical protein